MTNARSGFAAIALGFAMTFAITQGAQAARKSAAEAAAESAAEAAMEAANDDATMNAADAAAGVIDAATLQSVDITQPFGKAWSGSEIGDVTLVIFADYGCPACREAQAVTDRLIVEDPKLRVVYRLIALDGYPGRTPGYASLDVATENDKPGADQASERTGNRDWNRFHRALIARAAVTGKAVAEAARAASIPGSALVTGFSLSNPANAHPNSMSHDAELAGNENELTARGASSLPAWSVGNGGAIEGHDYAAIKAAIAEYRESVRP